MIKDLRLAILPVVIAIISGASLSFIYSNIKGQIKENKKLFRKEAIYKTYAELGYLVDKSKYCIAQKCVDIELSEEKVLTIEAEQENKEYSTLYYKVCKKKGCNPLHDNEFEYAFALEGKKLGVKGFSGPIDILLVVDKDLRIIKGIQILDSLETPGLGTKIEDRDKFRRYFEDLIPGKKITYVGNMPETHDDDGSKSDKVKAVTGGTVYKDKYKTAGKVKAIAGVTISSKACVNTINEGLDIIRKNKSNLK